ncbi:hypothetical protein NHQ30_005881 [Ciborinia camelliae]|nr:hypothetical protein NHQ30_005881 [Ciborinia camelliae]
MPLRFPPRVPREYIHNLTPMTQDELDAARMEFPEEKLASRALEKYARKYRVEGRYFWKDGFRYVCGPAMIDRPKKKGLRILVAHKSEGEWALPQDHHRHLLNFPQGMLLSDLFLSHHLELTAFDAEIIDMICRCVLTVKDHTITPNVTTSNWTRAFKSDQTYSLDGKRSLTSDRSLSTIIIKSRQDRQGKYFEIRRVYRPRIDATLLRVCKRFNKDATSMLYAENIFQFRTMDWTMNGSPGSWIDGKENMYYLDELPLSLTHTWDDFPINRPSHVDTRFREASSGINNQETFQVAYNICDHFFRFLHSIGKRNIKFIKTLHFSGTVLLHNCRVHHFHETSVELCNKDIIDSFKLYIPIINEFCIGLEKLSIEVHEDEYANESTLDDLELAGSPAQQFEKRLSILLEQDIRALHSLKTLEIYKTKNTDILNHTEREEIDFAEPTIAWFKDRAKAREADKGEE